MLRACFDHAAATPVLPEVCAAMAPFFRENFGNPGSLHQLGVQARDALAQARAQVAALINAASPEEVHFTATAAEAVYWAVRGAAQAPRGRGTHLVTSAVEHPNVFRALESLAPLGFTCTRVAVDAMGRVDPEAVRTALTEQTVLLAVHQANHDVGTIQRVLELSRLAADRGITFFVDATSSAGWLPVDVQTSAISLLALAPHRFHGPKGVGALYRNRRTRFARGLPGSPPEEGPGSAKENVPAIVGAGVAAECARREFEPRRSLTRRLQQRLWSELPRRVPYLKRHGPEPGPERLTTSVSFSAEFIDGEAQALVLDTRGIAAASGSSCVAKALRASPVLTALGVDPALAQSNLVLSLGANNTDEEVAYFLETYPAIVEKLRGLSPRWDEFQRGLCDSIINPRLS